MTPGHLAHPQRTRHSSSGDTSLKTADMWNIPRTKKMERSRSEGNFARKYHINGTRNQSKRYGHITVPSNSQGALVTFNTNLLRKGLTLRLYLGVW